MASTSRSRSINEESQGRTQAGAEAEAFGGTLLTGLFSSKAEDNLPGVVLPMMSWALLHQLAMKTMSAEMLQASLTEQCFNKGFLLPGGFSLCQVGKRNQPIVMAMSMGSYGVADSPYVTFFTAVIKYFTEVT